MDNNIYQQPNLNPNPEFDSSQSDANFKDYKALRMVLIILIIIIWVGCLFIVFSLLFSGMDYMAGIGFMLIFGKIIIIALFVSLVFSIINLTLIYKAKLKKNLAFVLLILSLIFSIGLLILFRITFKTELQQEKEYKNEINESIKAIKNAKIAKIELPTDIKEETFSKGQLLSKANFPNSPEGAGKIATTWDSYYFDEKTKTIKEYKPKFWIENNIQLASQYTARKLVLSNNSDRYFLIDYMNKLAFKVEGEHIPRINIGTNHGLFFMQDTQYNNYVINQETLRIEKTSEQFQKCDDVNTYYSGYVNRFLDHYNLAPKENILKNPNDSISWIDFGENKQLGYTSLDGWFFSDSSQNTIYKIIPPVKNLEFSLICKDK